jgi:transketolase
MKEEFIEALSYLAEKDPNVMVLSGDLGFAVFNDFIARFPKQFLNVGIAEQNMSGLATGLALEGKIIFTYSIGNFPTLRCLEQIRNDICYHDCHVIIVSIGGGFSYGPLGISHHATEDISIMRALPNIKVVCPATDRDAYNATLELYHHKGPAYLRLDKSKVASPEESQFKLGKSTQWTDGKDITLISTGGILEEVLNAQKQLAQKNVNARVIDMSSIKPFDKDAVIKASRETGGVVAIEEHTTHGGLGGIISESLMQSGVYPKKFLSIGLESEFSSIVGSQTYLRHQYKMDAENITSRVLQLLN